MAKKTKAAKSAKTVNWSAAIKHLRKDKTLRRIIDRVDVCSLTPSKSYFIDLVESIVGQQVSVAAARSINAKFAAKFPRKKPTPELVLKFFAESDEETIKSTGVSKQKRAYLIDLSQHFVDNRIPHRKFSKMTDEEIIDCLVAVKGIGRWTAEMILIFSLNRPDVWPVDDLGIRESVFRHFKLKERPTAKALRDFADAWRPYRSVASWYLWKGRDTK